MQKDSGKFTEISKQVGYHLPFSWTASYETWGEGVDPVFLGPYFIDDHFFVFDNELRLLINSSDSGQRWHIMDTPCATPSYLESANEYLYLTCDNITSGPIYAYSPSNRKWTEVVLKEMLNYFFYLNNGMYIGIRKWRIL